MEQQAATSEVGELEQVFQSILEKATRICEANFDTSFRFDGKVFRLVARFGTPSELIEAQTRLGLSWEEACELNPMLKAAPAQIATE